MRTRRTNRTKSYTIEKYDFEGSSDEEAQKKRRKAVDAEEDDNFEVDEAVQGNVEGGEDEDDGADADIGGSDVAVSDPDEAPDRFSRQRVKPIRPFNVRAAGITGYLDVEPVAADGRIVRAYCGPYERGLRGQALARSWYGQHPNGLVTALGMLDRWMDWSVLPPKTREGEAKDERGVWSPGFFEREAFNAEHWYERVRESMPTFQRIGLSDEEAKRYRFGRESMPVMMGPHDLQSEVLFEPLAGCSISQSGLPFDQDDSHDKITGGWMFDTGGIALSLDWKSRHKENMPQLLAIAIIPHSDQEDYNYEQESAKPDFQRYGAVQLWEFHGERAENGYMRPAPQPPRLRKTLCFDFGRARRVKWAPACDLLAVICSNGNVYVVEAGEDGNGDYERIQEPVSIFQVPEDNVEATSMTWVNFNRLVVGYTDGSVALWSVCPNRLLSRHPIHHNPVINMASGYPAMPYILASAPIGGTAKLVDLRAPSDETTEVQALTVTTQPNLMAYSDHLLGFISMYPSAGALNTQLGFMHHAHYPITRRLFTNESFLSCVSAGRTHPYLLIGSTDGSLWALNPQVELFTTRREPTDRIRIFHHEHRPANFFPPESPASARGASRIVQGFTMERSLNPKTDVFKAPVKKGGKKTKKNKGDDSIVEEDEEGGGPIDPTRAVIYEASTRVTVVEWNPNEDYGCWAAAAMASGLVRVLDLGLETAADE